MKTSARPFTSILASIAVLSGVAFSTSACGTTAADLPLPKPGVGSDTYTVNAVFVDALNLPNQAHVKVGGSDVGMVTDISASNYAANVQMKIRSDVVLPEGTTAELRQATPLGDVYVAIALPTRADGGQPLRDGATINLEHTSAGASVEDLLTSVAMLLNGGAISQVARITSEMDSMLVGRGPQLSHLLRELTGVIGSVNQRTTQIDSTLGGLNSLLGNLAQRREELGAAADTFPDLVGVISENNESISSLIGKVGVTMAAVGDFTDTTGPEFKKLFDSVQRLMTGFTEMGDDLAGTLEGLHAVHPGVMASIEGPALAVAVTVSYLSISALTDPKAGRLPNGSDVPAFIGSLGQVLEKVIYRLQSQPR
ncbi:MCE family protein [Aldersonia kunmingensis]|uniref:MCE family protein n=1 Tax=Aldersonia kunmingensis TaxID=408066 RepID=UPI00083224A6|nr:MCE family protein [Aldersonia kunmingensis]